MFCQPLQALPYWNQRKIEESSWILCQNIHFECSASHWIPYGNPYNKQVMLSSRHFRLYDHHDTLYKPFEHLYSPCCLRIKSFKYVLSGCKHCLSEVSQCKKSSGSFLTKYSVWKILPSTEPHMVVVGTSLFYSNVAKNFTNRFSGRPMHNMLHFALCSALDFAARS